LRRFSSRQNPLWAMSVRRDAEARCPCPFRGGILAWRGRAGEDSGRGERKRPMPGWVADTGLFESHGWAGEPMTGCPMIATNPAARPRALDFTHIQCAGWLQPSSPMRQSKRRYMWRATNKSEARRPASSVLHHLSVVFAKGSILVEAPRLPDGPGADGHECRLGVESASSPRILVDDFQRRGQSLPAR